MNIYIYIYIYVYTLQIITLIITHHDNVNTLCWLSSACGDAAPRSLLLAVLHHLAIVVR